MNKERNVLAVVLTLGSLAFSTPWFGRAFAASDDPGSRKAISLSDLALIGDSMQEVLLALPPPKSVYLAGADDESPRPRASDAVVFRYELSASIQEPHAAVLFVNFDPDTYRAEKIRLVVNDRVPAEAVIAALAPRPYARERRRVETDDLEFWVSEEKDPEGEAEVMAFADLGLQVTQIDGMNSTTFDFGPHD